MQDSGRDTGALLRGVPVAEAGRWLNQRPDDLGPAEQHYITSSRASHGRTVRRLRVLSGGLALLLVAALILGVPIFQASRREQALSDLNASRYLATQAEALEVTRPELALLLAIAAFQIDDTPEATNQLVRMASHRRDAQALLVGHTELVVALAFNPTDGRMLVSAGADNTLAFWDVERPEPVATLPVSASKIAFSPDGDVLASGGSNNQVQRWDPHRRTELGSPLVGAPDELLGLTFSPDGRMLVGCGHSGEGEEIVLWELEAPARPQRISTSCWYRGSAKSNLVWVHRHRPAAASSSVAEVEPAADTVVVRVDQVVSGAPAFRDHLGEPITVALPDGVEVANGDVHVFQAMAWIFGTGLAVRAISVGDQAVFAAALTSPDRP